MRRHLNKKKSVQSRTNPKSENLGEQRDRWRKPKPCCSVQRSFENESFVSLVTDNPKSKEPNYQNEWSPFFSILVLYVLYLHHQRVECDYDTGGAMSNDWLCPLFGWGLILSAVDFLLSDFVFMAVFWPTTNRGPRSSVVQHWWGCLSRKAGRFKEILQSTVSICSCDILYFSRWFNDFHFLCFYGSNLKIEPYFEIRCNPCSFVFETDFYSWRDMTSCLENSGWSQ